MTIRSETLKRHRHRIPQLPDFIAEKFRDEAEVELTPGEQQVADAVIGEATNVLRTIQLAERRAMLYGKGWRRLESAFDDEDN